MSIISSSALAEEGHDHDSHDVKEKDNHADEDHKEEKHEDHDGHSEKKHKNDSHDEDEHGHGESGGEDGHEGHDEHGENSVEMELDKAKRAGVKISSVGEVKLNKAMRFYGETTLDLDNIVHVVPRFSGVIQEVGKHLGESVKKGDLLAKIQSNESLSSYDINSEIDGVIIRKDAALGEFVNEEKEIFVVANLDSVWVNVALYPKDLKRIQLGTPARVISEAAELTQTGNINYIRPTLTERTRTALARIELDNKPLKWFPGMFVEVEALLDSENAPIGVPSSSLVMLNNQMSVFVLSKTKDGDTGFEVRNVRVGKSDGESTEILFGLNAGEQVASGRTFILKAELGKGEAEHEH